MIQSKEIDVQAMNNLFNPESRSKQTNNFNPIYSDNPNAYIDYEVIKSQSVGLNLATENPIGAGIVNAFAGGVIGNGLKLESYVDKTLLKGVSEKEITKIQDVIESYWKVWSETPSMCDHYQKNSLATIEKMALKSIVSEGDGLLHVGIVKDGNTYYPQIQWIDGTSVVTPPEKMGQENIVSGVEIDNNGRDLAYYVKQSKGNDLNITYKRCAVKSRVRNTIAFQLIKFNEIQQNIVRGRSMLIPVKDLLIQGGRYIEAEVTKAIIQSYMTFFITKTEEYEGSGTSTAENILNSAASISTDDGATEPEDEREPIGLSPGGFVELKANENIVLPESKSPTAGFKEFMEMQLKLIGMGSGIPYESLLKTFNSSYSASQASLQEAARGYAIIRGEFVTKFMMPVYIAFVDCLILQGVIKCKGYEDNVYTKSAWLRANWYGPAMLNIDPVKNAKAAVSAINANLTTREKVARELYENDFYSIIPRRGKEEQLIKDNMPQESVASEGVETVTNESNTDNSNKGDSDAK